MRRIVISLFSGIVIIGFFIFGSYWLNTQPIWVIDSQIDSVMLSKLPTKNKQILELLEAEGKQMAPTYNDVVCTEFVIKVIDSFEPLSKIEKNDIRIITTENLDSLVQNESAVIKGVKTALLKEEKGIDIVKCEDVRPGDFVQFWNVYQNKVYGHCGVVFNINANKTITLYSSHPFTDGFGKQEYLWPDKIYFVRLK